MTETERKPTDTGTENKTERQYEVWLCGNYAGSVLGFDQRDARIQAARVFMSSLRDVSVLPPY